MTPGLLLVLALTANHALVARPPEAAPAFTCRFDTANDLDFDGWPDEWLRRRGPGFPHYVSMRLSDVSPGAGRSLCVELDGGAAEADSPPIAVNRCFQYVLQVRAKTSGLKHDTAFVSVTLCDVRHRPLQTLSSPPLTAAGDWQTLQVGPLDVAPPDAKFAVIGLHVQPGELEDLTGTVWFGDVWFGRLPRLTLRSNEPDNLLLAPAAAEITCDVSGAFDQPPKLTFELEDVWARRLAAVERPVTLQPAAEGQRTGSDTADVAAATEGVVTWRPALPAPGFYRVRATLHGRHGVAQSAVLDLTLATPSAAPAVSEFGWSLPYDGCGLPPSALGRLLSQAGVHWVKLPVFGAAAASGDALDHAAALVDRAADQGLEVVALVGAPPTVQARFGTAQPPIADVFALEPKVWTAALQPVLARLAMSVHWWQLGYDDDTSFCGRPHLAEKITEIRTALAPSAPDLKLGLPWSWLYDWPAGKDDAASCQFLALSATPPPNPAELAVLLAVPKPNGCRRWLSLRPLERNAYTLETRVADLVGQMIAAKVHGAEAIFCNQPFDAARGLLADDGTPGELFLPWRTTALMLGGSEYLGSLVLPGGSRNHVFARNGQAVLVVASDRPCREPLPTSGEVRAVDVWGHSQELPLRQEGRSLAVGDLPTFVTGLSVPMVRWQLDLRLAQDKLPSVFDRPHENLVQVKNRYGRGISGHATVVAPPGWKVEPSQWTLQLADGEQLRQPLAITLPSTADSGRQLLRFDFELQADPPQHFSVYRWIDVGLGDVSIEVASRLDAQGNLDVVQRLTNTTTDAVNFRCQLYAPGRRLLKTQIIGLSQGTDVKVYRLPDGDDLLGKQLWLRAEEIDGPRVLNHRFTAAK